jgi:1-acyl-sn-glycerol-3-phosphate acyltransferase
VRLALQTGAPIVPLAFVGGGEAIPTVANLYRAGELLGVPYLPITPYLAPLPLPVSLQLVYGRPMVLQGSASDSDEVIAEHVAAVKSRIASLLAQGRAVREGRLPPTEIDFG